MAYLHEDRRGFLRVMWYDKNRCRKAVRIGHKKRDRKDKRGLSDEQSQLYKEHLARPDGRNQRGRN